MNNLFYDNIYNSKYADKTRGLFLQRNDNTKDDTYRHTLHSNSRENDFWEINELLEYMKRKVGGSIKVNRSSILEIDIKIAITYEEI